MENKINKSENCEKCLFKDSLFCANHCTGESLDSLKAALGMKEDTNDKQNN